MRLDLGIFLLHLSMVSLFVVLPLSLGEAGLVAADHWKVYLPVVLLAIVLMVPFILIAERAGKVKAVLMGAALALALAMLGLALLDATVPTILLLLTVMFTVFNLLEAILPSLVSKAAAAGAKGTAMGVFSSAQFTGAFLGGLLGGLAHETLGPSAVFLLGAGASLLWLGIVATLRPPENLSSHVLPLGAMPATQAQTLRDQLLAVPGVEEAVVALDEGVAYLKVDNRQLDWARLRALSVGS